MKQITVQANDAGQRVDKFLTKTFAALPPPLMYKAIRTKNIKLNGAFFADFLYILARKLARKNNSREPDFRKAAHTLKVMHRHLC